MHHTIVVVDVEGFGGRDALHQTKVREGLNLALQQAFDRCGLPLRRCHQEDRGDGMRVLVPADISPDRLVECLPNELAGYLRKHNATADEQARIRLRIVIHSGEIGVDRQGFNGPALVRAARLLDSDALRRALARTTGIVAVITSDEFFRDVVSPNPAANPGIYRRVRVDVKETHVRAWICLPDHQGPVRPSRHEHGRHREPREIRPPRRVALFPLRVAGLAVLLLAAGQGNVLAAVPPADRCSEPVQLNVNVSPEKARVIQNLAAGFEHEPAGCKEVTVQVTVATSADAIVGALGRGWPETDQPQLGPQPHVLLPDSRWEFEAALGSVRLGERRDVSLHDLGSIASSPLVLAWTSTEGALGSDEPGSWADVLAVAQRGPGMLRPSPMSSGAGLVATIALYSAVLDGHLDEETLDDPDTATSLRRVERAVTAGGESATLLCALALRKENAVLVSEKAVRDHNEGTAGERCEPGDDPGPLRITYPTDGTLYLDHPFVAVDWHHLPDNPARDRAVRDFHRYLTAREAQDELRLAGFRNLGGDVAPFEGVPRNRPRDTDVGPVDVSDLLLAHNRVRQAARMQLLVDVSRAMLEPFPDIRGTRVSTAAAAASRALSSVGDQDEVSLWEFAEGVGGPADHRVLVPMGPDGLGRARRELERLRDDERAVGVRAAARVDGALRAAVTELWRSSGPTRTSDAVVILADGTAGPDPFTLPEFVGSGPRVPVFLIAFGTRVCESVGWTKIIRETGGECHEVADVADLDEALDSVATVLWGWT